jgi:hypothetical protein
LSSTLKRFARKRIVLHAGILAAYVVLALVLTDPVVRHPHSTIPIDHQIPGWAPGDGDPWQSLWAFWLVKHSLISTGRLPLRTDLIFYPLGADLWYVLLILPPVVVALALSWLMGLVATYNTMIVGSLALAGYTAFLLVRRVAGGAMGAFVGGLVFGFSPYHLAHSLEHVFLLASSIWVPLYVLFLIRTVEDGGARNVILATLWLVLAGMSNPYYAMALALLTVLLVGAKVAEAGRRPGRQPMRRCATALLPVGAVVVAPYCAWLVRQPAGDTAVAPSLAQVNQFSADILAFLVPSPLHPLWGSLTAPLYARFSGNLFEQTVYLGYLVLAFAGLAFARRRQQAGVWALSVTVFAVLSLGALLHVGGKWNFDIEGVPITFPLPGLLLQFLPGLGALRALSRFTVIVMLSLAVLAGLGVAALRDHPKVRARPLVVSGVGAVVALAILIEYLCIPLPVLPTEMPRVFEAMAAETGPRGSLLDVPLDARIAKYQYFQTAHHKPLISGHVPRLGLALARQTDGIPFLQFFQNPGGQCGLPSLQFIQNPGGQCREPQGAWNKISALRVVDLFNLDTIVLHGEYLHAATVARVRAAVMEHFPVDRSFEEGNLTVLQLHRDHDRLAVWPPNTYQFEFGPGAPRFFLAKGWWPPEEADAVGMAWSMGGQSTLGFFLPQAWAMTIELQLMPFVFPSAPSQRVTVDINTRVLGEIELPREWRWRVYSLPVPASAVRPGVNALRFTYAHTAAPSTVIPGNKDTRELAVAFSRVVLRPEQ